LALEMIKNQLDTRNAIAFAQEVRYHVNMVRTGHSQRVLMLTANGKVVREKLLEGDERLPEIMQVWAWRRDYKIEGFEEKE